MQPYRLEIRSLANPANFPDSFCQGKATFIVGVPWLPQLIFFGLSFSHHANSIRSLTDAPAAAFDP